MPISLSGRPAEVQPLCDRATRFMEEHLYASEKTLEAGGNEAEATMQRLQSITKAEGLWAPHLPEEVGGSGAGFLPYAYLNEIIGRSLYAPRAFGSQAPDAGNAEILWQFGTPEQKEQYLKPLVSGEIRSAVAMTEPEVSGADPTNLQTTAMEDGDEWVVNGHKWFTTGASAASFFIVMCKTDPDLARHQRFSQIIVPADTPGFRINRQVTVMGDTSGDHCDIQFEDCRVPRANLLGERSEGFLVAQRRLGPGRIHHCMRWLGQMQRAFELMCRYALEREVGGEPLAQKQTVQNWIADSAAQIQASRLLTLQAAEKIDAGEDARVEVSLIKFVGAQALHDVIDRAIQTHGARGVSGDTPLESMYREARGARILDGPDEVHRQVVARRILRSYRENAPWSFV
jgi:alkylation response protein AidB-like acyl-CoA dehydrogenase